MDGMREVVAVLIVSQVWHELVKVARVGLEGAARREVDISDDLVHANASRHIAALRGLLVKLVCPSFVFALITQQI